MNIRDYEYSPALKKVLSKKEYQMSDALLSTLNIERAQQKIGISEDRIRESLATIEKYIGYWREYPDMFIDFLLPKNSKFNLFFYQRIFLRAAMRHKYCYATFPRAFSKSFLAVLVLMIRCILYPGAKLFIVSGTKEQGKELPFRAKSVKAVMLIPN